MSRFFRTTFIIVIFILVSPATVLAVTSPISAVQERNAAQANIEGIEFDYNLGPGQGSLYLKFFDGDPSIGEPFGLRLVPSSLSLDKTETANNAPYNVANFEVLGTIASNFLKVFGIGSLTNGLIRYNDAVGAARFQWSPDGGTTWKEFGGSITGGACPAGQFATGVNADGTPVCAAEIQNVTLNRGLERDASNNFGLIASCTLNQVLKWNGTGWSCAADSDSDVWSAITGGINYPGGVNKVGINDSDLSDTAALLQVGGSASIANDLGVLGSGSFGGTVSANSGVFTRGGNVVAQSAFSSNWKYEPGGFSAGHSAPRCNAAGTDGKLTCDISDSTQDCGGLVYDIGTDPGASPVTCYDWYVSLAGSNEQRAYNRVASATTGGWVSGMSGYSDTISLGGDSTGDDLEVRINAPSNRNKISFTNQTTGGLAAIRAGGLTLQNGTEADGKVLVSDATGNASWADPVISGGGSSTESLWSGPSLTGSIYYNGGNVGIGTANPGAKLDVSGIIMGGGGVANLDPAGTIDDVLFNNLKNSGKFAIGWNRTAGGGETDFISSRNGGSTGGFRFYDLANDGTLSSSLVTITGGGNVGIRTAGPIAKLQVNDTSTSHITIGGQSTDTGVGGWDRWCAHCGDSINGTPNLWLNARDAMKFNSGSFEFGGGNVGIGTANPSNPLTVFTPGGGSPVGAMSVDVNTFGTADNAAASYYFRVRDLGAGSTPFYIRGNGNVGIGTANPGAKLDVNGSAFVNLDLGVGGRGLIANNLGVGTAQPIARLNVVGKTYKTGAGTLHVGTTGGDNYITINSGSFSVGEDIRLTGTGIAEMRGVITSVTGTRLDVVMPFTVGTGDYGVLIESGFAVADIRSSANASLFYVNNISGNVGIGTAGPDTKLNLFSSTAADMLDIDMNPTGSGESHIVLRGTNKAAQLRLAANATAGSFNPLVQSGDARLIFANSAGEGDSGGLVIGPWSASAKGLRVDSSGRVGIGTADPDGLQINTAMPGSESSRGVANVRLGVNFTPRIVLDNGNSEWEIDNANDIFRIFKPGAVKFSIDSSGNVSISGRITGGARGPAVYSRHSSCSGAHVFSFNDRCSDGDGNYYDTTLRGYLLAP